MDAKCRNHTVHLSQVAVAHHLIQQPGPWQESEPGPSSKSIKIWKTLLRKDASDSNPEKTTSGPGEVSAVSPFIINRGSPLLEMASPT